MGSESNTSRLPKRGGAFAGGIATAVGVLVLLGWAFDISILKSMHPGSVSMKANTAVCFVLSGIALLGRQPSRGERWGQLSNVCAGLVGLIGVLTASEYLCGWNLGIDELLVRDVARAVGTGSPGRMAPIAAFNFAAVGAALVLFARPSKRQRAVVHALMLAVLIGAILSLIGYLYGVEAFRGLASYTQIALHTSLTFVVLGCGILVSGPAYGIVPLVFSDTAGGTLMRRLMPATVAAPMLIGWLRLQGERLGWFDNVFGIAIVAAANIAVFALVVWTCARSLDVEHRSERVESNMRFRSALEAAPAGMLIANERGEIVLANAMVEELFGYSRQELIGQPSELLLPERFRGRGVFTAARVRPLGAGYHLHGRRKNGTELPIEIGLTVMTSAAGDVVLGSIVDTTERVQTESALRASNKELEQFAYVASHDLKSPLRAIENVSAWLEQDLREALTDETRELMTLLRGRVRRMDRLLDDLLAYARAGRVGVEVTDVDVAAVISEIVELSALPSGFMVDAQPPLPTFRTARLPLTQVLLNLITNACKHHDRTAGRISVTVGDVGEYFEFAVSDDGPGIPQQFHDKVFLIFQTLKPRAIIEGSGLGLALVKKLVENANGTVWIEGPSADTGRGTTLRFRWPKQWPEGAQPCVIAPSARIQNGGG